MALAMVLLVGAGLMMRSFLHLQQRDLGFEPANLLVVDVPPPTPEAALPFYEGLVAELAALPGVATAALGSSLPFAGPNSANVVAIEGRTFQPGEAPDADFRAVSPTYFRTLGIALVRGRTFAATNADATTVLINAAAARRFFGSDDPIGRRIRLGSAPWATVIGVVGDARYRGLDEPGDDARPMLYVPPEAARRPTMTIALRTVVSPDTLVGTVRRAIVAAAPRQPIARIEPLDAILAAERGPQRFNTTLLAGFACMALLLAAAGLWALIAHVVSRRTHEIGVRVALGAGPRDVLRMTAGKGLALAFAGIAIGLTASAGLTTMLQRLLFDVTPHDPATLAMVSVAFLVVAAGASVLPARRALRIDPAEALRLE
jgi:putative ABC transport system permease protein